MRHRRFILTLLAAFLFAFAARAEVVITLKKSFIDKFADRATIDARYKFDKAHKHPNPAKKDGDLHAAGRAPEIGLPSVAEIMNAKDEVAGVGAVHDNEGTDTALKVNGAWRIWPEHANGQDQIQGEAVPKATTTNPDHVFEIHPLIRIGDIDMRDSLHRTDGFEYKDAEDAFSRYENLRCRITPQGSKTTITTGMLGFNYVEFVLELVSPPIEIDDGLKVYASVYTLGGELLVRKRGMVFIKDTPPWTAVRDLHEGDKLHVVGVPRISLKLVQWRVANRNNPKYPGVLEWNLPYELIIVANMDMPADFSTDEQQ